MIDAASQELRERVHALLDRERLWAGNSDVYLDTPRRLAVLASRFLPRRPTSSSKLPGLQSNVAFKDGQPTPAAHAFAKKAGVDVSQLERAQLQGRIPRGKVTRKGRSRGGDSGRALPKEIASIYWPKNMYWRKPTSASCARCAGWWRCWTRRSSRWSLMESGQATSRADTAFWPMVQSQSRGQGPLIEALRAGQGLGRERTRESDSQSPRRCDSHHSRRTLARRQVAARHGRQSHRISVGDSGRLRSGISGVAGRSVGHGDARSSEIFCDRRCARQPLPHFLAVLNTDGDPQGMIRHGNERVLRARFNDARFFWQTDQKHPLRERIAWLKNVTFQKDLGSYYEKTLRVQRLCSWLCEINQAERDGGSPGRGSQGRMCWRRPI